jgi:hypothetical protein
MVVVSIGFTVRLATDVIGSVAAAGAVESVVVGAVAGVPGSIEPFKGV